jgi:hypothetical protein
MKNWMGKVRRTRRERSVAFESAGAAYKSKLACPSSPMISLGREGWGQGSRCDPLESLFRCFLGEQIPSTVARRQKE